MIKLRTKRRKTCARKTIFQKSPRSSNLQAVKLWSINIKFRQRRNRRRWHLGRITAFINLFSHNKSSVLQSRLLNWWETWLFWSSLVEYFSLSVDFRVPNSCMHSFSMAARNLSWQDSSRASDALRGPELDRLLVSCRFRRTLPTWPPLEYFSCILANNLFVISLLLFRGSFPTQVLSLDGLKMNWFGREF